MQYEMNLEAVRDIYRLFAEINEIKRSQASLHKSKDRYADLVNELMGFCVEDSFTGEKLAKQTLELGEHIKKTMDEGDQQIQKLEDELCTKYGFVRAEKAA